MTDLSPVAQLQIALSLLLAAALGGVVGWQRESAHKPAGLRTHILITLGAALFTLISVYGFRGADASRVAAGVVTGIGFLGAGAIMQRSQTVEGLTTAASIWSVAAIGVAVGVGLYYVAVIATILVFLVLFFVFPSDKT